MDLEWDETKREKTLRERGLDFADLAGLDWGAIETFEDTRRDYGEERRHAFVMLRGRNVRVTFTDRGSRRRIISLHPVKEGRTK